MYTSSATIKDIYRLAMPPNTKLLYGAEHLGRPVTWACSLRPSPPAFPKLDGNEIALIDMDDLRRLDPQMRLERVVASLRDARISAIAVLGPVSEAAVRAATTSQAPLFQLPDDAQIVQVERTIIRLIVDRAGYIAQRSSELQRELNQIALDGGGLSQVAQHISAFAQQPFLILREDGQIAGEGGLERYADVRRQTIAASTPNIMALRTWAARHPAHQLGAAIGTLPMERGAVAEDFPEVVVAPVYTSDAIRGYIVMLRPASNAGHEINTVEQIAVGQGAAAVALEWAKQYAIDIAEERMRATFLDELLASSIVDEQAWIQRGASLGYDLTQPHAAWMVEGRGIPDWPAPLLRFAEDHDVSLPYSRREEGLLLFWPIDNAKSARELKTLATDFAAQLLGTNSKARLIIGIGRPAVGPGNWMTSQQQARESWRMGKEWKAAPVTYFGDLGLYQLLTMLGNNAEARRFYRKTLGRLIAHDEEHNSELVDTLEGFFICHGNLSQTATRLHIHRNTLTYRLERIANVTQLDLDDPDARFSLQLALKLRPVMK
jgi:purine catabolism regulator